MRCNDKDSTTEYIVMHGLVSRHLLNVAEEYKSQRFEAGRLLQSLYSNTGVVNPKRTCIDFWFQLAGKMPHSFLVKKKDFKKALAVQFADRVFPVATNYIPFPHDVPQFLGIPPPYPAYAFFREYPIHWMPPVPQMGTPIPVIREVMPQIKDEQVIKKETGAEEEKDRQRAEKPGNGSEESNAFKCPHCSKVFTRSWNFHRHVLIHSGQKPYKCQVCPKAFALAAHLKIHNRIHTGEKPYTCNVCQRGFAQLTNLQRHILTHTGQKPHKCTYCPKAFVSSSDLRRHIRIHTGERPYKCKQCTKAFTTSGNLQSHILTHTGEKPYQCKICNWKFISSSNLRTHMRIHHAVQTNQRDLVTSKGKKKTTPKESESVPKFYEECI